MYLFPSAVDVRCSMPTRTVLPVLALILVAISIGLATPAMASPGISSSWAELREGDERVATVMYRLAVANRRFCRGALAPQSGLALHSLAQYAPAERPGAARAFGLGAHIGVMAVVAGSPAARAGVRADDQLLAINGRQLANVTLDIPTPTDTFVKTIDQLLAAAMRKGEVALLMNGPGGDYLAHFTAEQGCRSTAEFDPGAAINASADGERLMVSAGLLARCTGDDDLALVIAHELAHNLLHHAARLARAGIVSGFLPSGAAASAAVEATEEEADALGVRLATAAGYDLSRSVAFIAGLQARPGFDRLPATHPAPARRLALLTAAIADANRRPGFYGLTGQAASLRRAGRRYH
jgi:hypothetical protein